MTVTRRAVLAASPFALAAAAVPALGADADPAPVLAPPTKDGQRVWMSPKFSMLQGPSLEKRLEVARDAGYDGVDFDEAGGYTPAQVRDAARKVGIFVHGTINHGHWSVRHTSADPKQRDQARANLEHCLRVSHAAGGSSVLLVIGSSKDGAENDCADRAFESISRSLPLAAALGQKILFESVWNGLFYDEKSGPEQDCGRFKAFVERFDSPWVGWHFDIGNHWKYANPGTWIKALGRQVVKLDVKGSRRPKGEPGIDIHAGDLPWKDVQAALREIHFTGWASAEIAGGGLDRHKKILDDMRTALLG